jgi:glycosyltransferase involved in cell wall biosynthesis
MALTVCFILERLGGSGGVRAVVQHAARLRAHHGMDVSIAASSDAAEPIAGVPLITHEEATARTWDIAVATWWRTAFELFSLDAQRHVYFVQQFDERLYEPGAPERVGATLTHDLPVAFVTEAAWIAGQLRKMRPEAACHHVPNGVDKELFSRAVGMPADPDVLRVMVEGSPALWFKGVREAAEVLASVRAPLSTTLVTPEPPDPGIASAFDRVLGPLDHDRMPAVYAENDVVLKLSRVEGVFTPPLEGFHMGATCVVWPVTGHDEYVRHGYNGAVVDFDDIPGTAWWLDLLARDRALLRKLREGALETARGWPSWDDASARMADVLNAIAAGPAPAGGSAALLADLDAGMEELRAARLRDRREVDETRSAAEDWIDAVKASRTFRVQRLLQRLLASVRR